MTLRTLPRSRTACGVAFVDVGDGDGEPVVLVHGVGLRLEAWAPQIESLSQTHRVIALDLPGHGESDPIPAGSMLPQFVDWFLCALDELNIEAANVAGHSMGALIAGGAAISAPERARRVAMLSAVHRRDAAAAAAVRARAVEIAAGQLDRLAPLERWFEPDHRESEPCRLISQWLSAVDLAGYATAYGAFAEGDRHYADAWSCVTCPALFLTGELDANSTPQMSRELAAAVANGESYVVAGHRHMVNMTGPDEVNAALRRWLERKA